MTVSPDGPWTKEIRSLEETIQAYSMLESNEKKETYYSICKNCINYALVIISKKNNYLSYYKQSLKNLKPIKKVIYHKNQLWSE